MGIPILAALRSVARQTQALVWPHLCALCGNALGDGASVSLCARCLAEISPVPVGTCRICGREVAAPTDERCGRCLVRHPNFDAARSAIALAGKGRDLVLRMKYGRQRWLAHLLARLVFDVLARDGLDRGIDLVAPVPSHWARRARLFGNPAASLGRELATLLGRPFNARLLATSRGLGSRRQQGLSMRDRLGNVKGTISVRRPETVKGLNVLVTDDVMTTGATVDEAARVLKHAGARVVRVATAARTDLLGEATQC